MRRIQVSGHDFSRAVKAKIDEGFSPCYRHSPQTAGVLIMRLENHAKAGSIEK
jgi:hypothetical protein